MSAIVRLPAQKKGSDAFSPIDEIHRFGEKPHVERKTGINGGSLCAWRKRGQTRFLPRSTGPELWRPYKCREPCDKCLRTARLPKALRIVLILFLLAWAVNADKVLRELSRPGMRQEGIDVEPGQFNEAHLERLARNELAKKPHVPFTQLAIYGEKGGAPLPKPDHVAYDYWINLRQSLTKSANEVGEMIAIRQDSILRLRDPNGRVVRKVLTGKDPVQLKVGADDFEIVYFAFSTPSPNILQRVDVYVRTAATLKPEKGFELLRTLRPLFPALEVSVVIRNDAWFIYQPTYPFVNPFVEDQKVPIAADYNKTRTLVCGSWPSDAPCRFE